MKKGSRHSEETLRKMREKVNREPRPPEIKQKISLSKLENPHPFRGKSLSEEHKRNISLGMRKRQSKEEELQETA